MATCDQSADTVCIVIAPRAHSRGAPSTMDGGGSGGAAALLRRRRADERTGDCGDSATPAEETRGAATGQGWRRWWRAVGGWETPAAYRTRLRVALALMALACLARYVNGGRLDVRRLLNNVLYHNGDDSYSVVIYGPNVALIALSFLVRFMLARPQAGE